MDERRRAEIAASWLERYGEPIDCDSLRGIVSLEAVETVRLDFLDIQSFASAVKTLERAKRVLLKALDVRRPGGARSIVQGLEAVARAQSRSETKAGITPSHAIVASGFHEIVKVIEDAQQTLRSNVELFPATFREVRTKGFDFGFARACFESGEWIRARHCDVRGQLDGRTSWPSAVELLEWYGHDLRHLASDRPGAIRKAAERWRGLARRTSEVARSGVE